MNNPQQIDSVSIARAANAAHFEYMATISRRIGEVARMTYYNDVSGIGE